VKNASSNIFTALLRARSEAVKRNGAVTLTPVGGNWQNGWNITDAGGNVIATQEALKGVAVTSNIATNVVYMNSGRIQGALAPTFSITHSSKAGDTTARLARCVSAAANGSPYVKPVACS
jgi:type IV fimbrial biogenesis protein FimT